MLYLLQRFDVLVAANVKFTVFLYDTIQYGGDVSDLFKYLTAKMDRRWRHHIPPKHWHLSVSQKAVIIYLCCTYFIKHLPTRNIIVE
jgi:hypothetical protein